MRGGREEGDGGREGWEEIGRVKEGGGRRGEE